MHKRSVGVWLREALNAIGLSQAQFGRDFGVSPPKLGNWLRGTHYPDPFIIYQFCERYGLTCDWIYRGQVSGVAGSVADALWRSKQEAAAAAPPAKAHQAL